MELCHRLQGRGRDRPAQGGLQPDANTDRAERRFVFPGGGEQVARDPAACDLLLSRRTAFHIVHGIEVGMCRIRRAAGMHNGQIAGLERL